MEVTIITYMSAQCVRLKGRRLGGGSTQTTVLLLLFSMAAFD